MDKFKASMTTDIAFTLHIPEDKVTDFQAKVAARSLLLREASHLLADQNVDVSFTIASGASTIFTPIQLARGYKYAVGNGTANFSSTQASGCPSFNASVSGVREATIVGQGTGGTVLLIVIILIVVICCAVAVCVIIKNKDKLKQIYKSKTGDAKVQQTGAGDKAGDAKVQSRA
jgi:hypothetical protein